MGLVKAIVLLMSLDISAWQDSLYSKLIKLSYPTFPNTTLENIDEHSVTFFSYSVVNDPGNKYYYVMHDAKSAPTWLFLMRHDNKIKDELWHRGYHNGFPCNVLDGDSLLFHVKTVGFIKTDVLFRVKYKVEDTRYGVVVSAIMDKSFLSNKVIEFKMLIWAFPHPTIKNLVIVVSQGYTKISYPVSILNNNIKWHVDSVLQNFGDRLTAVMK